MIICEIIKYFLCPLSTFLEFYLYGYFVTPTLLISNESSRLVSSGEPKA